MEEGRRLWSWSWGWFLAAVFKTTPMQQIRATSKAMQCHSSKSITDSINNLHLVIAADFRALFLSDSIITKVFCLTFPLLLYL
jgi:hypothetical protein